MTLGRDYFSQWKYVLAAISCELMSGSNINFGRFAVTWKKHFEVELVVEANWIIFSSHCMFLFLLIAPIIIYLFGAVVSMLISWAVFDLMSLGIQSAIGVRIFLNNSFNYRPNAILRWPIRGSGNESIEFNRSRNCFLCCFPLKSNAYPFLIGFVTTFEPSSSVRLREYRSRSLV